MVVQSNIEWVPVKLSYVEYPKGDVIGKVMAYISLSPLAIICAFIALITFRRDLHTITFFAGLLINDVVVSFLKIIIAQPRPLIRSSDVLYGEYGMPSSHAHFMFFMAAYMFYFIFFRINYMKSDFFSYIMKSVFMIFWFSWAVVVCISRIYLQYHTMEQVICGSITGAVFASVWFLLTQYIFTPYFPVVASWKISEVLLIRDTTVIPNILWFEYTSVRQEVRSRRRKSDSRKSQ